MFFLIGLSTLEPLTQAFLMKLDLYKESADMTFKWKENNLDFYSFIYENKKIDTKEDKYFLVGNTKDYFFYI
ncbi:hypothetical protein N7U66_14875 [Lacinutrix neustonica]|uniref:Uncharacterized protein n=1 Tax=Lacinutrix neustonica TaxID=2980107 RepID=A0A9E8MUV4_9FLAO|nr:hypothetical protein [Lacinutrix neustonica]WAC01344.1 hypothetical protein N7U66_14875 [Lacinutrix neustonica]